MRGSSVTMIVGYLCAVEPCWSGDLWSPYVRRLVPRRFESTTTATKVRRSVICVHPWCFPEVRGKRSAIWKSGVARVRASRVLKDMQSGQQEGYVGTEASPEAIRRARELVEQFPSCFWFWRDAPNIRFEEYVRSVIKNLRDYGDKDTWEAAKELNACL